MSQSTISHHLPALVDQLACAESLEPSPEINALFEELVRCVVHTPQHEVDAFRASSGFPTLASRSRKLAEQGETLLEYHWVERFLARTTLTQDDLNAFPYLACYQALAEHEHQIIQEHTSNTSLLFVGGGPLPLTAYLHAKRYGRAVRVLERDHAAAETSRLLLDKLGVTKNVEVVHADIHNYDVAEKTILLGALVGATEEEKRALIATLRSGATSKTLVIARGAQDLAELLYPPVPREPTLGYTKTIAERKDMINTLEVFTS
ncbi:hypothetical protein GVX82_03015 [Patescibacteria group bacterium]|jgi:hypothetical protein|nr:hypothetical protein [Patescibacteria group bacterium]